MLPDDAPVDTPGPTWPVAHVGEVRSDLITLRLMATGSSWKVAGKFRERLPWWRRL